jgi:DNA-binding Xre family transcriptional regulator
MMEMIHAGKCLKHAQIDKGVKSMDLAKITKTSPQQVLRWRTNSNMKLHTIQLLALSLDITIEDFISYHYK